MKKTLTLRFPPNAPKGAADDIHLKLTIGSKAAPIRDQMDGQKLRYDDAFMAEFQLDVNAHARLQDTKMLDQQSHEYIATALFNRLAKHIAERN